MGVTATGSGTHDGWTRVGRATRQGTSSIESGAPHTIPDSLVARKCTDSSSGDVAGDGGRRAGRPPPPSLWSVRGDVSDRRRAGAWSIPNRGIHARCCAFHPVPFPVSKVVPILPYQAARVGAPVEDGRPRPEGVGRLTAGGPIGTFAGQDSAYASRRSITSAWLPISRRTPRVAAIGRNTHRHAAPTATIGSDER